MTAYEAMLEPGIQLKEQTLEENVKRCGGIRADCEGCPTEKECFKLYCILIDRCGFQDLIRKRETNRRYKEKKRLEKIRG